MGHQTTRGGGGGWPHPAQDQGVCETRRRTVGLASRMGFTLPAGHWGSIPARSSSDLPVSYRPLHLSLLSITRSNKDHTGQPVPGAPSLVTCGHEFCLHFCFLGAKEHEERAQGKGAR